MAYAELAALRPRAGGEYVYLREAFGELAAFLTGWTSFVAGFTGAIAASAIVTTFYLDRFFPGSASSAPFFVVPLPYVPLSFSPQTLIAIAMIVLMAAIHVGGIGPGRLVGNVLAALKVSALLMFIALGFSLGAGSAANVTSAVSGPVVWTRLAARADSRDVHLFRVERRRLHRRGDSQSRTGMCRARLRSARRQSSSSTCRSTSLYLYVLPVGELAKVQGSRSRRHRRSAARRARRRNHGPGVDYQPRGEHQRDDLCRSEGWYDAMARDGLFFAAAGRVHPKFNMLAAAIIAQSIWGWLGCAVGQC